MTRRFPLLWGGLALALGLVATLAGCDYSSPVPPTGGATPGTYVQGNGLSPGGPAPRVGGVGDDRSRVRRVVRWIMDQIELVPAGALAAPGLGQAQARPYDVLMRGMATETEGFWAERGWVFMVLCRQLGVDVGLLT